MEIIVEPREYKLKCTHKFITKMIHFKIIKPVEPLFPIVKYVSGLQVLRNELLQLKNLVTKTNTLILNKGKWLLINSIHSSSY